VKDLPRSRSALRGHDFTLRYAENPVDVYNFIRNVGR
jgi:hypothetical protein